MASSQQDPIGIGSQFDEAYRLLLLSGDILGGDNPFSPNITDRGRIDAVIDNHARGEDSCLLLQDKRAGMSNAALVRKYGLFGLRAELEDILQSADVPDLRKGVLRREIAQADIFLRSAAFPNSGVGFTDLWSSVTGAPPPSLSVFDAEVDVLRDQLAFWLNRSGVAVTSRKGLKEAVVTWQQGHAPLGVDQEAEIRVIIDRAKADCLKAFTQLASLVPGLSDLVSQLRVDNFGFAVRPTMNFDAGMSYLGGDANGSPLFKALFEWNAGRISNRYDVYYIAFHEWVHALNTALTDLMVRSGRLGSEALLLTMSSGRAIEEEGMAQTLFEMAHGGTIDGVAAVHGIDMAVVMILDYLQDLARIYTAVGWNVDFAGVPEEVRQKHIRSIVEQRLVQPENIGYKYAEKKFWRMFPAGFMYAPAYWTGSRLFRKSMATHDVAATFAVGTHFAKGLVDYQAMKEILYL